MTLHRIRQTYDENYSKMLQIIQKMGGENKIKFHRENRTSLFRTLRQLQKKEHYLNELESRLLNPQEV
jgi:hypothetical protein